MPLCVTAEGFAQTSTPSNKLLNRKLNYNCTEVPSHRPFEPEVRVSQLNLFLLCRIDGSCFCAPIESSTDNDGDEEDDLKNQKRGHKLSSACPHYGDTIVREFFLTWWFNPRANGLMARNLIFIVDRLKKMFATIIIFPLWYTQNGLPGLGHSHSLAIRHSLTSIAITTTAMRWWNCNGNGATRC